MSDTRAAIRELRSLSEKRSTQGLSEQERSRLAELRERLGLPSEPSEARTNGSRPGGPAPPAPAVAGPAVSQGTAPEVAASPTAPVALPRLDALELPWPETEATLEPLEPRAELPPLASLPELESEPPLEPAPELQTGFLAPEPGLVPETEPPPSLESSITPSDLEAQAPLPELEVRAPEREELAEPPVVEPDAVAVTGFQGAAAETGASELDFLPPLEPLSRRPSLAERIDAAVEVGHSSETEAEALAWGAVPVTSSEPLPPEELGATPLDVADPAAEFRGVEVGSPIELSSADVVLVESKPAAEAELGGQPADPVPLAELHEFVGAQPEDPRALAFDDQGEQPTFAPEELQATEAELASVPEAFQPAPLDQLPELEPEPAPLDQLPELEPEAAPLDQLPELEAEAAPLDQVPELEPEPAPLEQLPEFEAEAAPLDQVPELEPEPAPPPPAPAAPRIVVPRPPPGPPSPQPAVAAAPAPRVAQTVSPAAHATAPHPAPAMPPAPSAPEAGAAAARRSGAMPASGGPARTTVPPPPPPEYALGEDGRRLPTIAPAVPEPPQLKRQFGRSGPFDRNQAVLLTPAPLDVMDDAEALPPAEPPPMPVTDVATGAEVFGGTYLSPTFVEGEHRVVLHTLEGQVRRGTVKDVDLLDPLIRLAQPGRPPEAIAAERVKAIFFMQEPGTAPLPSAGRRIRVAFADGRQIVGFSEDVDAGEQGFFLIPADTRTHTARIYVFRAGIASISAA